MKELKEITASQDYINHVWMAAMNEFANTSEDGPSLYHDSFTNKDIIYHLRSSRKLNVSRDELAINDIKNFLSKLENVSDDIYQAFTEIYDRYIKLADSFGYMEDYTINLLKAYDVKNFNEIWANENFKNQFTTDKKTLVSRLKSIQTIVETL